MSITQKNPTGFSYSDLSDAQTQTYKGKADITISEYDTDSAPSVKVGSVFENNGSLFIVDTSDITPTGYSGISVSTTFYLYFDASAVAFIYSSTVPVWSDVLGGWYNGDDRAFFSMYKDSGGTLYEQKSELGKQKIPGDNIDNLTVNNTLTPSSSPTEGSNVVTSGTTWIIPRGVYIFIYNSFTTNYPEIYVNSTWTKVSLSTGGCIFSDGVNVRMNNTGGTDITYRYLKF